VVYLGLPAPGDKVGFGGAHLVRSYGSIDVKSELGVEASKTDSGPPEICVSWYVRKRLIIVKSVT